MRRSHTLVPLKHCPPGLFLFEGALHFRSEYSTTNAQGVSQPDAYCVETGEYFWGGAKDARARSRLRVEPVRVPVAL